MTPSETCSCAERPDRSWRVLQWLQRCLHLAHRVRSCHRDLAALCRARRLSVIRHDRHVNPAWIWPAFSGNSSPLSSSHVLVYERLHVIPFCWHLQCQDPRRPSLLRYLAFLCDHRRVPSWSIIPGRVKHCLSETVRRGSHVHRSYTPRPPRPRYLQFPSSLPK
jgi:hypothetical protein